MGFGCQPCRVSRRVPRTPKGTTTGEALPAEETHKIQRNTDAVFFVVPSEQLRKHLALHPLFTIIH